MPGSDMFYRDESLGGGDVAHGFFGRRGGVSAGIFSSLNCGRGSGDVAEAVVENRRRVQAGLEAGQAKLLTLWQMHTPLCINVGNDNLWALDDAAQSPRADAMVTKEAGLMLGILTADCAPVLFRGADKAGRPVIGAAHAGWKGALGGVLENTARAMRKAGAESVSAVIGPCIGQASYEVSADFVAPFMTQDAGNALFFSAGKNDGVRQFDLPGYVARRLALAGVKVAGGAVDTYAGEKDYFSYRRTTHRGEPDYGRQLSVIVIGA